MWVSKIIGIHFKQWIMPCNFLCLQSLFQLDNFRFAQNATQICVFMYINVVNEWAMSIAKWDTLNSRAFYFFLLFLATTIVQNLSLSHQRHAIFRWRYRKKIFTNLNTRTYYIHSERCRDKELLVVWAMYTHTHTMYYILYLA